MTLQIEWNLVIAPGLAQRPASDGNNPSVNTTTDNGQIKSRIYCELVFIELAYTTPTQDDSSMRPRFYALTNAEINNQVRFYCNTVCISREAKVT